MEIETIKFYKTPIYTRRANEAYLNRHIEDKVFMDKLKERKRENVKKWRINKIENGTWKHHCDICDKDVVFMGQHEKTQKHIKAKALNEKTHQICNLINACFDRCIIFIAEK